MPKEQYGVCLNHTDLLGIRMLGDALSKLFPCLRVEVVYVRDLTHGETTQHWDHPSEGVIAFGAGYRDLDTGKAGRVKVGIVLSHVQRVRDGYYIKLPETMTLECRGALLPRETECDEVFGPLGEDGRYRLSVSHAVPTLCGI